MGWCSATGIMDTAIRAALSVLLAQDELTAEAAAGSRLSTEDALESLRPFVLAVANSLRDGDWDCQSESAYFDTFPQEMTGWTDFDYAEWLAGQIEGDPLNNTKHVAALAALQEKRQANGR